VTQPELPRYGPFHRLESPTQTPEDARLQVESQEIWGRTPRFGLGPTVQAILGPLPDGTRGIEFYTPISPDSGEYPVHICWSREGRGTKDEVLVEGDYAKIPCVVVRVRQGEPE
jgi:hypothetical protein